MTDVEPAMTSDAAGGTWSDAGGTLLTKSISTSDITGTIDAGAGSDDCFVMKVDFE
jgi:hypothetical protein